MNRDAIALHQHGVELQQAGNLREAVQLYSQALELDERLELTRFNLAVVYNQLGEVDQAISQYKTLLSAHPHNVKAWFNLAAVYSSIGRNEQAVQAYQQVLALEGGHAMALANLAWLYGQQKRYGEAISTYERLLELAPDNTTVLFNLGHMHRMAGDMDQAEVYWRTVVTVDPRHIQGLLCMAEVCRSREDWHGTLRWSLDALGVDAAHPAARIMAAKSHMELLEYAQAASILWSLAEEHPQLAEVRYLLGMLSHQRGELGEAQVHLGEAVRLADHHPEYLNEYGSVLYRLGEVEEAARYFRQAEELQPDNAIIKANLGYCYMQLGHREAAAKYFEAFLARPAASESVRLAVQCALDLL